MNQILVTDKIIVTKEIKQKKRFYKGNIILSIFLMCVLCSYYVYAEYDRNKYEQKSKDILNNLNIEETIATQEEEDTTTIDDYIFVATNSIMVEDDILKVVIGGSTEIAEEVKLGNILKDVRHVMEEQEPSEEQSSQGAEVYTTEDGQTTYYAESIVKIPKIGIEYPVLSETTDELLKISVNKLWGPAPNEIGNYVIVGHNYKSGKMFGKLKNVNIGDIVELTDLTGRTVKYVISDKYIIEPSDVQCTSQLTNGRRQITLITCSNSGSKRLVVQGYEQE